jgi:hypothetical protein
MAAGLQKPLQQLRKIARELRLVKVSTRHPFHTSAISSLTSLTGFYFRLLRFKLKFFLQIIFFSTPQVFLLYFLLRSSQGRTKTPCTGTISPTNQPRKDFRPFSCSCFLSHIAISSARLPLLLFSVV